MSLTLEKKIPIIKWYQIHNHIYFNIYVQNLTKESVIISNNKFSLNNDNYSIEFDFIEEINHENIQFKETEKFLKIIIEKMNNDQWKHLAKYNLYKNNIKVDWDNWFDEDAEDEQEEMDFSQMMGGMPGMEGMMGGMPGMEGMMENMDEDIDDEELENDNKFESLNEDGELNEDIELNEDSKLNEDSELNEDNESNYEDMPDLIDDSTDDEDLLNETDEQEFDYEEAAQMKGELEEYYEELEENNKN